MAIGYIIGAAPMIVAVADFPAVGDVEADVTFENGNRVGTFAVPAEEDVELDVQYGEDGTEFTGSFIPVYAGQDIVGTLAKSVTLTGEIDTS